ncbi:MAG: mota/tolq/exbb proton channel family [Chthoniobacteraceae bacterium]|nr:mota/tolq/exbb proton channel family [Chthoniobacteraceae bacterium]MDB6174642.1 mota/tolq/exbb proton channel family [Chthoniobacteraceae bacterium]
MKIVTSLFALILGASTLFGQDSGAPRIGEGDTPAATQTSRKVSSGRPDDAISIKSPGKTGAEAETVKLWTLIHSGGWPMVPLGALSVITVMLVLVYLVTLRRGAILTANYMNTADVLLKKRDYLGLLAISNRHSEAIARVVQRTLDFATKNPGATFEVLKEIAETEGQSQAASLQHRTVYLADIGTLAPMIGLLGTVFGIIESFGVLGSVTKGETSRDVLLAGGVSTALVATAGGLVLGIVAMGFYSLFRNRVQSLISDLEIASAHVLGLIALNYNKKREQPSRVPIDDEY